MSELLRKLRELSDKDIMQMVNKVYSGVAERPDSVKSIFPVGKEFAISLAYLPDILQRLPQGFTESFAGAGNPQTYVDIGPGEVILDLGCGAGLDLYLYSIKTGKQGLVYGVDFSLSMLKKTKGNLEEVGVKNFRIICSSAQNIPLQNNCIDVVASNGIYNLCPDKEAVMKEVYRVLRPRGRVVLSEIVLKEEFKKEERITIKDWFRCIGGALPEDMFIDLMKRTGFVKIEVISKGRNARTKHPLSICANIRAYKR